MTGTNCDLFTHKSSRSYLNHLVFLLPSACNNSAPTARISMKFDIWFLPKMCRENSSFIKIWQKKLVLYIKTFSNLCRYLAKFFSEWKMLPTKLQRKRKNIQCAVTFFLKSCHLWENVEKCDGPRQDTNDNTIWRIRVACWISKAIWAHAYSHCHAPGDTTTDTHAPSRAHTEKYAIRTAFTRQ